MAHFSVVVPDNKVKFFKELLNNLKFVGVREDDQSHLTDNHKDILNERISKYNKNPEFFLDWEVVENDLVKRYDL